MSPSPTPYKYHPRNMDKINTLLLIVYSARLTYTLKNAGVRYSDSECEGTCEFLYPPPWKKVDLCFHAPV